MGGDSNLGSVRTCLKKGEDSSILGTLDAGWPLDQKPGQWACQGNTSGSGLFGGGEVTGGGCDDTPWYTAWKLTAGSPKNHLHLKSGKSSEPHLHDFGFHLHFSRVYQKMISKKWPLFWWGGSGGKYPPWNYKSKSPWDWKIIRLPFGAIWAYIFRGGESLWILSIRPWILQVE